MSAAYLVACSSPAVTVDPPDSRATSAQCRDLVASLPSTVMDQERRDVEPAGAPAAAWGSPAIVLSCGVGKPTALRRDSSCLVVNDVGWLASQKGVALDLNASPGGDVTFTTIGRSPYVELLVPGEWTPQGNALVDVADAVATATDEVGPCK